MTNLSSSNGVGGGGSGNGSSSTINNDHKDIEILNPKMLTGVGMSSTAGLVPTEPGPNHSLAAQSSAAVAGRSASAGPGSSSSGSVENMSTIENGDLSIFTFIVPNSSASASCSACSSPLGSPSATRHNSLCNLMHHHEPASDGPSSLSSYYSHSSGSYGRKYSLPSTSCTCAKTSYIGNGGNAFNGTHSATLFHGNGADTGGGGGRASSAGLFSNGYGRRSRNSDDAPGLSNFSLDSLRLENPCHKLPTTQHSLYGQYHHHHLHRHCQHHHRCEECEPKPTSPFLSHRNQHQQRHSSVLNDRNYLRSLSRSGDDLLLRSLEKGGQLGINYTIYNVSLAHA